VEHELIDLDGVTIWVGAEIGSGIVIVYRRRPSLRVDRVRSRPCIWQVATLLARHGVFASENKEGVIFLLKAIFVFLRTIMNSVMVGQREKCNVSLFNTSLFRRRRIKEKEGKKGRIGFQPSRSIATIFTKLKFSNGFRGGYLPSFRKRGRGGAQRKSKNGKNIILCSMWFFFASVKGESVLRKKTRF